ncbi:MAG: serine/threonine-protein kinase [Labilithrix sp.]
MLAAGELFDRYRIEDVLGRGGMGTVYRAVDERLRRPVALKTLDHKLPDEARALLVREARISAGLNHPNIVMVHDVGESRGVTYLVMELVEGVPLRHYVGQPIKTTQALQWLLDVARALDEAHRAGLVHRDIKPTNIMIAAAGAKILDFGIAKPTDEAAAKFTAAMPRMRTAPGSSVGTPRYMAPEQLRGGKVDGRADQFAWGLVAHQLLLGTHPRGDEWDGSSVLPPLDLARLTRPLAAILRRSLQDSAEQRWPTMGDLADALAPLAGPRGGTMQFRAFGAATKEEPEPVDEPPGSTRMVSQTGMQKAVPSLGREEPVVPDLDFERSARNQDVAASPFAALEPTTLAAFVSVVHGDLAKRGPYLSAVAIVTLDVNGERGRFFVQPIALRSTAREPSSWLDATASSPEALRAAGDLIGADARAGNARWSRAVIHLDASGKVSRPVELG